MTITNDLSPLVQMQFMELAVDAIGKKAQELLASRPQDK